jgi:hypothetical protein
MQLFEYAIIKDEKLNKDGEVIEPAAILVEPKFVLAKDEKQMAIIASKAISDDDMDDLDRIQIVVRPF